MQQRSLLLVAVLAVAIAGVGVVLWNGWLPGMQSAHTWNDDQQVAIASLSIDALPPLPPDPSNAVGDDPRAIELGHALFFDTRLSSDGAVACATCHQPDRYFTDGLARAEVGRGPTRRNTPTIVGTAYNPWLYWDGRRDSQWAQALTPLEAAVEHGGTRAQYLQVVAAHYRQAYEAIFGPLPETPELERLPAAAGPFGSDEEQAAWANLTQAEQRQIDEVYANVGKAIAAYERRILPDRSPFDDYAQAVRDGDTDRMESIFTDEEAAGLRLFIGQANCTDCHNGPLFSNGTFHNIGLSALAGEVIDTGRVDGVLQVRDDPFNCLGDFSDAAPADCQELRFVKLEGVELLGAFKTPSLRNVSQTAPYMHDGRFADLSAVLAHYNAAPPAFPGHSDLLPLDLSAEQMEALEAFLHTLDGPLTAPAELLEPPTP